MEKLAPVRMHIAAPSYLLLLHEWCSTVHEDNNRHDISVAETNILKLRSTTGTAMPVSGG